ncbi:TetR/AcrR family transcriptional regulator [Enhygromyxa salina]|uniref:TetR/AcrR family transcriptional regulator n=1 Tax=Enhygromyxa salina TaxID=215803 RepID=UPI0004E6B34A|nr:TetR/AcrR family transcriptional regulator [Enhygromyxa salina]
MPRAKAFDPDIVLDRAIELFWRRGYEGASMAKLLECMGISRQSLYDTFGDKHRLFLAAIDRYCINLRSEFERIVSTQASGTAGIRAGFDWVRSEVVEHPEHRSCLMANSALELGQRDPELRARVAEHLLEIEEVFFTALERDNVTGEINGKRDNRALARFLTNSMHGLGVLSRGGASQLAVRDTIETTLSVLTV